MLIIGVGFASLSSARTVGDVGSSVVGMGIGMILLVALGGLIFLCEAALKLTGMGFMLAVPPGKSGSGLKGLAIAAFALVAAGVAFNLLGDLLLWIDIGASIFASPAGLFYVTHPIGIVGALCALAGFIVFMLFLRAIAQSVRQKGLAQTIVTYMISVAIFAGVCILFWIILLIAGAATFASIMSAPTPGAAQTAASTGAALGVLSCAFFGLMGVGWLCLFIWYIVLLHQVRGAVDTYIRRAL
jgi:hypothetical protein